LAPPTQPHVPPQPSPPPQVPSVGQLGLQQLPPYRTDPLAHAQVLPQPSGMPARLPFVGQLGAQHAPMYSVWPEGHAQVPPQPLSLPALLPSVGQLGLQQPPLYSTDPLAHPHVFPHPSVIPPRLPSAGQFGLQQLPLYSTDPLAHPHVFPHPSVIPPRLPSAGQLGVQTQAPPTQRPAVPQSVAHLHVSMQVPLLHTLPAAHFTPAQRLTTQVPPAQTWLLAHGALAHGLAAAQARLHALPGPHAASHGVRATHFPDACEQYCPDGHVTPLQGWAKQPATHWPSTQVWSLGQVLPAHGSATSTHEARQVVPAAHVEAGAVRQGSS
jgi:hypothetical protein